ncbi:MAG: hypothetical protein JST88_08110 [Bacteroidetes bacterium]|nr:hypothetical protein [Bacteroidota bacterium]
MKKSSILMGALALSAITMGTTPSFASLRSTNGVAISDAKCGDKKAEMKKGKAKDGKCGEGKCGGKSSKKGAKEQAKEQQKPSN